MSAVPLKKTGSQRVDSGFSIAKCNNPTAWFTVTGCRGFHEITQFWGTETWPRTQVRPSPKSTQSNQVGSQVCMSICQIPKWIQRDPIQVVMDMESQTGQYWYVYTTGQTMLLTVFSSNIASVDGNNARRECCTSSCWPEWVRQRGWNLWSEEEVQMQSTRIFFGR